LPFLAYGPAHPTTWPRTTETTRSGGNHSSGVESYCEDTTGTDTVDTYWEQYEGFQFINTMLAKGLSYYLKNANVAITVIDLIDRDKCLAWTDYNTLLADVHDSLVAKYSFNLADSVYVKLVGLGYSGADALKAKNAILDGYLERDGIYFYCKIGLPFQDETVFNHERWGGIYPERCMGTLSGWEERHYGWYLDGGTPIHIQLTGIQEQETPIWVLNFGFKAIPTCWVEINILAPLERCKCQPLNCGEQTIWACAPGGPHGQNGCGRMTAGGCSGGCNRTDQVACKK
jgi:hypothetical protein